MKRYMIVTYFDGKEAESWKVSSSLPCNRNFLISELEFAEAEFTEAKLFEINEVASALCTDTET